MTHSPWTDRLQVVSEIMPRRTSPTQGSPLAIFGARVRFLREQSGLSQEAFALKAGLDRTYVSGIERGTRNIGVLNVYRIAAALAVHPRELFLTDVSPADSAQDFRPKQATPPRNRSVASSS